MASVVRSAPAFKLGKKQLFMPMALVVMIHRPKQDPYFATFKVPLRFTKFDLRDYLWNLYKVEVSKVRSFVTPSPVINTMTENVNQRARIRRGNSEKYMTVELLSPFAWPKPPTDLEPWNKKLWDARSEYSKELGKLQETRAKMMTPCPSEEKPSADDKELAKRAKKLLAGEAVWSNGEVLDVKWEKFNQIEEEAEFETVEPVEKEGEGKATVAP